MDYTSAPNNVGGQFSPGDPVLGQPATTVDTVWMNGVQNELVGLISDAGLTPSDLDDTQIRQAIRRWVSSENQIFNAGLRFDTGAVLDLPSGTDTEEIAAGWFLSTTGASTITRASQDPTGFIIQGSGNIGDVIELTQLHTKNKHQSRIINTGLTPQPVKTYTAAIRAFSLGSDGSVGVTVGVKPTVIGASLYTITEIDSTTASIGGGVDVQDMASIRYQLANKSGQGTSDSSNCPVFTFTLDATGSFKFRVNGTGQWEGNVPDLFLPSCIISDHNADLALYDSEFKDRYSISRSYKDFTGWAQPNGISPWTNSWINVWVPYPKPLEHTFVFAETQVTNVSGTIGGNPITVNTAQAQTASTVSGSAGLHILINADHASLSDFHDFYYKIDFDYWLLKGGSLS